MTDFQKCVWARTPVHICIGWQAIFCSEVESFAPNVEPWKEAELCQFHYMLEPTSIIKLSQPQNGHQWNVISQGRKFTCKHTSLPCCLLS